MEKEILKFWSLENWNLLDYWCLACLREAASAKAGAWNLNSITNQYICKD